MDNDAPPRAGWVPHKPEQRLSIAINRFLGRALVEPCYFTALHDADGVQRTDNARTRDHARGVKSGQLDWDVVQGEPTNARKLELKRGKNRLSDNQKVTIQALTRCGLPPIVAYSVREAYEGLRKAGFRFYDDVEHHLRDVEAKLAEMDRDAELRKAGVAPAKKARPRKASPRYQMKLNTVARLRKSGILI